MFRHRFGLCLFVLLLVGALYTSNMPTHAAPNGGISLAMTVGIDPHTCATSEILTVTQGQTVIYCYRITNSSGFTLTSHDLNDSELGILLADYGAIVPPNASLAITTTAVVTTTTVYTGSWYATAPIDYAIAPAICGTFPDITATGIAYALEDDGMVDVPLTESFPFYDTYLNAIGVHNNGAVTVPNGVLGVTNEPFPNSTYPRVIAAYWDDLDTETGNVYVGDWLATFADGAEASAALPPGATTAQGPYRYLVVEWYQRSHYPGPSTGVATFALAMLYPRQGYDGYMFTCYISTDFGDPLYNSGASATVGLNQNGANAHLFSFDTVNSTVFNGSGALRFDATGVPQEFSASDSARVNVQTPDVVVAPLQIIENHTTPPQKTNRAITIRNAGQGTLQWSIAEGTTNCAISGNVGWLTTFPTTGMLEAGQTATVDVFLNSSGLPLGTQRAKLCVVSNDPNTSVVPVDVELRVDPNAPPTTRILYLPVVRRR